ncbi:MAG: CDP-glucose 4,6-dehydratase, partial [Fusobacteriaceae bacterium]
EDNQKYSSGWNFGPELDSIVPVWDIAKKVVKYYGKGKLKDTSDNNSIHESKLLLLDITKAKFELGWSPKLTIDKSIKLTVDWYKRYPNENVYNLCVEQINSFLK